LYKNTVTDEDGNKTIEFKNGQGQTILVRKMLDDVTKADTYYVYNDYNQLAYVIPPLAVTANTVDETTLNNLCYQYKYDERNRLVEKKLPGKGWEYMVYDKADRLVGTQDANLRLTSTWLVTKYDRFGRVIYTGLMPLPNETRESLQGMTNPHVIVESSNSTGFTKNGMQIYYTNSLYSQIETILSVNYYDTYPAGSPTIPTQILGQSVLQHDAQNSNISTKSLPVASYVKNIEDDNWTRNYTWYDTKGRAIGSHSINHLGGYTKTESELDFSGTPKIAVTRHKRLDSDTERVITENFTYDHQNRLLTHTHKVDNNPAEYLAQNKYNELSQLEYKKVGGTSLNSPLQQVDYQYNIRGWMTKINNPNDLSGGDLFGYEIKYTNPVYNSLTTGKYNGNIAEVDWRNSFDNILKRYDYTYDGLNRLKKGLYAEPDAVNPQNGNFDEYLTYDLNGNISNLQRKAVPVSGLTSTVVDNLDYQYTGNRLNRIVENAMNDTGYEGGNNMIDYDQNGNMINMIDKSIQSIVYNHLNLPNFYSIPQINMAGLLVPSDISYLYRADGVKLRKINRIGGGRGQSVTSSITDYLDGFHYSYEDTVTPCDWCRTAVAFEQQAYQKNEIIINPGGVITPPQIPTWNLNFVSTAEGFYSYVENRYIYQYSDHLGNARLSYAKKIDGSLEITDKNDYYPFGLNHIGGSKSLFGGYQNYKYQGQELQETGFYSFKWRNYMPDVGRFFNIDPLAETYPTWGPYVFSGNRVIDARELEGLEPYVLFNTRENAAINFGQQYNGKSIKQNTEYASIIYAQKVDGKLYYAYKNPSGGAQDKASTTIDSPAGTSPVAAIHTHGKYLKGYTNNEFSRKSKTNPNNGDVEAYEGANLDGFVVTPNGSLKYYDVSSNSEKILRTNLPSDPNDPDRKNKVAPNDNPSPSAGDYKPNFFPNLQKVSPIEKKQPVLDGILKSINDRRKDIGESKIN